MNIVKSTKRQAGSAGGFVGHAGQEPAQLGQRVPDALADLGAPQLALPAVVPEGFQRVADVDLVQPQVGGRLGLGQDVRDGPAVGEAGDGRRR